MTYLDNKHGNVTICMQYMWPINNQGPTYIYQVYTYA